MLHIDGCRCPEWREIDARAMTACMPRTEAQWGMETEYVAVYCVASRLRDASRYAVYHPNLRCAILDTVAFFSFSPTVPADRDLSSPP